MPWCEEKCYKFKCDICNTIIVSALSSLKNWQIIEEKCFCPNHKNTSKTLCSSDLNYAEAIVATEVFIKGDLKCAGAIVDAEMSIKGDLSCAGTIVASKASIKEDLNCAGAINVREAFIKGDLNTITAFVKEGVVSKSINSDTIDCNSLMSKKAITSGGPITAQGQMVANEALIKGDLTCEAITASKASVKGDLNCRVMVTGEAVISEAFIKGNLTCGAIVSKSLNSQVINSDTISCNSVISKKSIMAGESITAQGPIFAESSVIIKGELKCSGATVAGEVLISGDLTMEDGSIISKSLKSPFINSDTISCNSVTSKKSITAGSVISQGPIIAESSIITRGSLSVRGTISCKGSISTNGSIEVKHGITSESVITDSVTTKCLSLKGPVLLDNVIIATNNANSLIVENKETGVDVFTVDAKNKIVSINAKLVYTYEIIENDNVELSIDKIVSLISGKQLKLKNGQDGQIKLIVLLKNGTDNSVYINDVLTAIISPVFLTFINGAWISLS